VKERTKRGTRLRRTIVVLALGIAIGTMIVATPAMSHVGGTVSHLWNDHIKPKADARYVNVKGDEKGVAVAGLSMNAAGTVTRYWNRYGGAPVVSHTADSGVYYVGFPGKVFTNTNSTLSATPDTPSSVSTAINADYITGAGVSIAVLTKNSTDNAFADRGFHLTVYLASPTG
jgi:hypothetical protein